MCGCSKLKGMRKKKSKGSPKKVTLGMYDVVVAAVGAAANFTVNAVTKSVIADVPPMVKQALPFIKLLGGGAIALNVDDRNAKMFGLGFAGGAAVEVAASYAPQIFTLSGVGDVFETIGTIGAGATDTVYLPIGESKRQPMEFWNDDAIMGAESSTYNYATPMI